MSALAKALGELRAANAAVARLNLRLAAAALELAACALCGGRLARGRCPRCRKLPQARKN